MSEQHESDSSDGGAPAAGSESHGSQRASFLGFVAHEMRNPLSTALWSAELLARLSPQERGGARGEKLAGMCLRSLQRLRILVEDHFLSERLDVGGMPVRPEAVPIRDVVQSSTARAGISELTVDVDADLAVWADRTMLERAVEGVVAVASRGKTPVRVHGTREGATVTLRVQGAPPAPDAVEPPQKGTASDPSGRALALYMAGHVARVLGGALSTAGGDYVLSLPCAPHGATADAT